MKKSLYVLSLITLTLVGALFTVQASNMFFADVLNISAGAFTSSIFVTLPAGAVAVTFALGILYLFRLYKNQNCFKRLSRHYLMLTIIFNCLGLLGAVLSGVLVYHSFVGPNPFKGYLILFMILHVVLISGSIFGLLSLKKAKENEGRIQIKPLYVLKTAGWFLFIMLLLNRLGTFLGAPSYIYLRNLYKTFPFYIWLLMPLFIGVVEALFVFEILDSKKIKLLTFIGFGVNTALFIYIAIMGASDSGFISSLSQTLPLERLASKPLEILIHVLSYFGVCAALLVQNRKPKAAE